MKKNIQGEQNEKVGGNNSSLLSELDSTGALLELDIIGALLSKQVTAYL